MRSGVLRFVSILSFILALTHTGYAQEASLTGTITDSTGGVLPGVTVTAVHEATGNTFQAVTDEHGTFRLPLRTGNFRIAAELPGFATINRTLDLLVGQQATVNLQMVPSTVQETVTVTGEAPLIETSKSTLGGNVDPKQMQELPVNGRNWMDLVVLAPGNRSNAIGDQPTPERGSHRSDGDFTLNIDGQDVTNNTNFGNQPRFSRDAIAEFQFVSSRFDATQGRSSATQVNAVTKSGTNTPSGSVSGYFRDDRFNAPDLVAKRVLPYSNQQLSGTFGGPIRRDRIHAFGYYEYEREPQTATYNSPYPKFNIDQKGDRTAHNGGVRLDFQLSSQIRLMTRGNMWETTRLNSASGSATTHPSSQGELRSHADQLFVTLTHVLNSRTLNEIKAGYFGIAARNRSSIKWTGADNPKLADGYVYGAPRVNFIGYSIGPSNINWHQVLGQTRLSIRDDFTYSFTKGGRHDVKMGGELISPHYFLLNCRQCFGVIDAQGGAVPANIEALFPVWDDPSTWNLAAISPIIRNYQLGVGNFRGEVPRKVYAVWVQDDWQLSSRLTLNLGLRYDAATNTWANWLAVPPILERNRTNDLNNVGPRIGFAYSLNDRTVIRGGGGVYYGDLSDDVSSFTITAAGVFVAQVPSDRRSDFGSNPFNGPIPTFEQLDAQWARTGLPLRTTSGAIAPPEVLKAQIPSSYQASIGMQRQLGPVMSVDLDYAYTGTRHERYQQPNANLSYDPNTGLNYPAADLTRRPYAGWGVVDMANMNAKVDYHALQTAFTRRFSQRWQASGTYIFSGLWDEEPLPISGFQVVSFKVAPDLGGERTLAQSDQRHRATFNGIWDVGYGFQLSGLYFFGSGTRFPTSYGGDRRNLGATTGSARLRPDGSIVTRNGFVGEPLHRVDLRLQRRFSLGGMKSIEGLLEIFNVFNHANFGSYTTVESNSEYGKPSQNANVAYAPRTLQLGFRSTF